MQPPWSPLEEAGRAPYVHYPMGYGGYQRSRTVTNRPGGELEDRVFAGETLYCLDS